MSNWMNSATITAKQPPIQAHNCAQTCPRPAFVKLFLPMVDNNNQYIHKYIHTYIYMIYIFLTFVVYQPFKDLLLNVENSKLL